MTYTVSGGTLNPTQLNLNSGQSGVSDSMFGCCYGVTSAAPLVASLPTDHLHTGSRHLQDTIHSHSSLTINCLPTCTLQSSDKLLLSAPQMVLALLLKAFSLELTVI